ncbi:hypothetical protein ZHAS_00019479 [Anopheles sinensis]|uniref:Uncharacterized protein n=1 Tax=Anopheles sinensis TaxID=74873 RepID=A0A084WLX0_ANOSI|nr:hypothetical protein ZHAS_00019479 [Anopheles sinensis]
MAPAAGKFRPAWVLLVFAGCLLAANAKAVDTIPVSPHSHPRQAHFPTTLDHPLSSSYLTLATGISLPRDRIEADLNEAGKYKAKNPARV